MIQLRALGTAEIDTGVSKITPSQEVIFAAALYLILERGRPVSRTHLAGILWPDVGEKARAHRLRQTILQLKKLGVKLITDRNKLQVSECDVRIDTDVFSTPQGIDPPEPQSVEFLPGYAPRLSEPLSDWVDLKRADANARTTRALVRQLEHFRLQADWQSVETTAARCLSLDMYNEIAVLARAEAMAMRGAKREAVSILDRHMAEMGTDQPNLQLPASLLRRRVVERIPDVPETFVADPPFLGREVHMEALVQRFVRAQAAKGSATLLIGDPGVGKSRLGIELGRFAELQGAVVQRAQCRRTDADRPLSIFVDIVPQLRELPGALGCAPETFASLKRLTEFEPSSASLSRLRDADMLFEGVRAALFDLFDSLAEERCLVLLIDDIQWLDNASAKILARMAEWSATKRIFFLINSRPGKNVFLEFTERIQIDTINLDPLTQATAATLLRAIANNLGKPPDVEFVDWCLAVAEGNPFFLQELAHHWAETGRRYETPTSIAKVLHERLSRLNADALQVLQTCAILGDCATIDRVEKVLRYQPHMLLAALEELAKAAMLISEGDEMDMPNEHLQLRHDFLASAALSRMAPLSKVFIHRRSADVLENEVVRESMPTNLLWACADHRHKAGDRKRALLLRQSCSQHLLELGLPKDAIRRYEESLGYCNSDEDKLAILSALSAALQLDGQWERAKDILHTCVRLKASGADPEPHNEFEVLLFHARYRSGLDFETLLTDVLPCVVCSNATPQHRVAAAVVALKVASDVGPSVTLDAIYSEVESLLTLEEIDPAARLEVEIIHKTVRGGEAIDVAQLKKFSLIVRSLHGEVAYSHALATCSSSCRIAGQYEYAHSFLDSAIRHALDHKLEGRVAGINVCAIRLHAAEGNWKAAREIHTRLQRPPIAEDNGANQAEWDYYDARIAFEEGDFAQAEKAEGRLELVPEGLSVNRRAALIALALRIRLAQDPNVDLVRRLVRGLEAAHQINRDIGDQDFETYALFLGLSALGEGERGLELLREYVSQYRHTRRPLSKEICVALDQPVWRPRVVRRARIRLTAKT